jgi:hypothetical protein
MLALNVRAYLSVRIGRENPNDSILHANKRTLSRSSSDLQVLHDDFEANDLCTHLSSRERQMIANLEWYHLCYIRDEEIVGSKSVRLGALRIAGTTRHTHWNSTECDDTWVLVIGSEEGIECIAGRVYSVGVVDPDRRSIEYLYNVRMKHRRNYNGGIPLLHHLWRDFQSFPY